ncbi:hypothetical protein WN51_01865 [Melipona quadrifasciata]|uniref:Uncharacterized protein n=1 Tax=Melipona quadrifasciata TaxID=166423 RepID=A0A0M8ZX67_9HYME|nr:hypothetical protein WN51_01865 [Melipona quadrifasciata]
MRFAGIVIDKIFWAPICASRVSGLKPQVTQQPSTSGRDQLRDHEQTMIERHKETSPGQPRQEGRLPNQSLESKILGWSQTTVYKAKRSRYPLLSSYGESSFHSLFDLRGRDRMERTDSSDLQQLIGQRSRVKFDLLTNLPTNLSNVELLINNNAHKTNRDVEEREEEIEIEDETAKAGVEVTHGIHDTVTSIDITAFVCGGYTRDPESLDDGDDQRNASSSSHSIDHTGFVGGSTPSILELGVARRPSESSTFRDDPSVPYTPRTPDGHFSGTIANTAGATSERERADHGAGCAVRPRSPQDFGPQRESEQPLQQLVPQPRSTDRVQIQDDLPANVHVVIHGKMNSKREPDIDDTHNTIDSNIIKLTIISPKARDHNDAGGFLAASYGSSRTSASRLTSTRYSVAQTASRSLRRRIYTVTSSESASLYDKSPEEKGTFATENQQEGHCLDDENALENTSCPCSNLSSPKRKCSTTSDSSYVCSLTSVKTVASLDHSIGVHDLHANNEANATKHIPRISSSFDDDGKTDACNDKNQQLDKGSNVIDHRHINESTDSNLNANTDATSEPIADKYNKLSKDVKQSPAREE